MGKISSQTWWLTDMSLPARKIVEVQSSNGLVATIKQVGKGKYYSIKEIPKTHAIAQSIAAVPCFLTALEELNSWLVAPDLSQETIDHFRQVVSYALAKAQPA
jgi:hypothetical protein